MREQDSGPRDRPPASRLPSMSHGELGTLLQLAEARAPLFVRGQSMHVSSLFLACFGVIATSQGPAVDETRAAYEAAATTIGSLRYGDALCGRVDPTLWADGDPQLTALLARRDPIESLSALLQHADARVRPLALTALYDREDPKLRPLIATLASDDATSFCEPVAIHRVLRDTPPDPLEPRNVGWWARSICEHYMRAAGEYAGVGGDSEHAEFAAYWAERKDRASCVSWFAIKLQRACGASSPLRDEFLPRIRAVRAEVDALVPKERALALLFVATQREGFAAPNFDVVFATEAECVDAARELGRAELLAMLRCEPLWIDPDLRVTVDTQPAFVGMIDFVLRHAPQLLEPEDARLLLELQPWGRDESVRVSDCALYTAWWWIAAAELQPTHAQLVLETAYERRPKGRLTNPQDRADLLCARWRLCPTADDAWAIERFYTEPLDNDRSPPARTSWIHALSADGSQRARATLAALVRHPSFERIDAETLLAIADAVERWTGSKLIDPFERRLLRPPRSVERLGSVDGLAVATAEFPLQMREYSKRLAIWRELLRTSVARWAPDAK